MIVAISAQGRELSSPMDMRFGRARYFIIVDTEIQRLTVVENIQNLNATQGAGIQSAKLVMDHKTEVVITGHIGPKAFQVLQECNVRLYCGAGGTVAQMLEQLAESRLTPLVQANAESHWV